MKRRAIGWVEGIAVMLLAGGASADTGREASTDAGGDESPSDPCNFATGSAVFRYEQVLSCYHRVPFDATARDDILAVIAQHRSFSDLGELYDARVHWKDALARIATTPFDD